MISVNTLPPGAGYSQQLAMEVLIPVRDGSEALLRGATRSARAAWIAVATVAVALGGIALAWGSRPPPARKVADAFEGYRDFYPSILVANPRVLASLELDGFSFGDAMNVRDLAAPRLIDFREESAEILARSPIFADLAATLKDDLAVVSKMAPDMQVGVKTQHRMFDLSWLHSPRVHFELVGVVNRIDFRSLVPPGCGQTRLVYRLAYRPPDRPQTRLPMTINLIWENRQTRCDELAKSWLALEDADDVRGALLAGPLANISPTSFDRVEIDVQSWRMNSQARDMDDHAEYILRAFNVVNGHLVPDGLRNTPRQDLSPEQREALRSWIGKHLDEIDSGAAELPPQFLATQTVSVTPRGLSRAANHPFRALFPNEDVAFSDLPLSGRRTIGSPWQLVRRLDEMTCPGCHQARTVAGFQLLGEDRTDGTGDAMVVGMSEHLRGILGWRYKFLVAASEGKVYDMPVPVAEHVDDRGDYGAHCTSPKHPGHVKPEELPDWPCKRDFVCDFPVDGDPIGQCVPAGAKGPGDPCQDVALVTRLGGVDGDKATAHPVKGCGPGQGEKKSVCEPNHRGFAAGMCSVNCDNEGETLRGGTCVKVPHHGFETDCFKPDAILEQCLNTPPHFTTEYVRDCSRTAPCRDDFVCARIPSRMPFEGACVPPYFLFQARVDGPPKDR